MNSTDVYGIADFQNEFPVDSDGVPRVYIGTNQLPIQAAIDACVADRGDYVYIFGSLTITSPIFVNKKGISIVGGNAKMQPTGGNTSISNATAAIACFTISVDDVLISDIRTTNSGTGAVIGYDMSSVALNNCILRNLNVYKSGGDDNAGIAIKAGSPVETTFENIKIYAASAKDWVSGLLIVAGTNNYTSNVVINGCSGTGLTDATSVDSVFERIVLGSDVVVGADISGATSCFINSRNFAASEGTITAMTANVLVNGE